MAPRSVDQVFEGLKQPAMKVRHHPRTARYVEYFTASDKGRKLFTTWLRRSGKYRAMMEQALQERNLPKDLVAVACIESGFWPTARSTAGAVGLWQFMPSTARAYGLVVDRSVDERRNVWRSTDAASQHLADLHERFQSWELALAAYNMGYKQLLKRLHDAGAEDFWALSDAPDAMPRETRLYVPKIMAVALILANLQHFNFDDIEALPPLAGSELRVPPGVRLSLVARAAGTSLRHIHELNEEFRGDLVPDRGGPVTLHIPPKGVARARAMLPKLMKRADGDTLDKDVAPDFDWGTEEISAAKKSSKDRGAKDKDEAPTAGRVTRNKEFAGPGKSDRGEPDDGRTPAEPPPENDPEITPEPTTRGPTSTPAAAEVSKVSFQTSASTFPTTLQVHEVKRGDNLWKLSELYGVPRKTIVKDNHLKHPDTLVLGKVIVVNVPKKAGAPAPTTVDLAAAASAAGSSLSSEPLSGRDATARLEAMD
jgi:membrane-bound lytic murein transglycosylase D